MNFLWAFARELKEMKILYVFVDGCMEDEVFGHVLWEIYVDVCTADEIFEVFIGGCVTYENFANSCQKSRGG